MDVLRLAAEGLAGNADARELQAPEHRHDHRKGEGEDNLPQSVPHPVAMIQLFQQNVSVLGQVHTPFR